jgi:tRNA nucleotidyltransferase (CCA-adding enzyme)
MRLILTHEQADFDAVGATLAARLLDPDALAVLPRRLNRNVQAYLTLYGDGLSFLDPRDLPRRKIERVTLVDTQTLPSLRGLTPGAEVHIIDHHPAAEGGPSEWRKRVEEVGATTTLLVEALQDSGVGPPSLLEATLLLLGIYEDTGSLSYASTTPRDLRAAAWLVECGASLSLAADFLNNPLSPDQRKLYDRLLEGAETHTFHGLSVVIACAPALGVTEEFSTLAHKLRDLFDPAGLFVLVEIDGHVQMVARSSTDSLNVGEVAEHFGGGGHDRAAAALIRGRSSRQVRQDLLDLLPSRVRPLQTVGEIMSLRPQLLSPTASVKEAAEWMQRFGHEGYPVLERGRVVGLVTRRAVDRAMAHGMGDQPVSRVMDAGDLTVSPGDSVQHLQRVMIQHDWGQVPVADDRTGKIVGIVTRTDLLKTLAPSGAVPDDLLVRLEQSLPPARYRLLRKIGEKAEALGAALYVVGGFVRDLLLGVPSMDLDLVVEGDAIALARSLAETYGGRTSSHHRFGTAKWHVDPQAPALGRALGLASGPEGVPSSLDFVSARTEFYPHPSALPSVARGSIKLDLHRRDFTINTLALRLDGRHFGQLLDPWGGGRDLRQGLVRVLHSISFVDDPTRMLRAVRLEQRLGFTIEARTLELLGQALPLLARVSGERIRNELQLTFLEPGLSSAMARLHQLGLLAAIHSALPWDPWLEGRFEETRAFSAPEDWRLQGQPHPESLLYAVWLFQLAEVDVRAICDRMHFSLATRGIILESHRLGREMAGGLARLTPSEMVSRLEMAREAAIAAAWIAMPAPREERTVLARYLSEWRFVAPAADGEALRALGLPPGPAYGEILGALRAAWLDGGICTPEQEQAMLSRLVSQATVHG